MTVEGDLHNVMELVALISKVRSIIDTYMRQMGGVIIFPTRGHYIC